MKKRGQIFILDIMLAVFIIMIIVATSTYFFTKSDEDFLNSIQMAKTGSDIVTILEADGTIDSLSPNSIKTSVENLLPINYAMRLIINTTYYPAPIITETEQIIPEGRFIVGGKRFFTFEKNNEIHSGSIQYEAWLR